MELHVRLDPVRVKSGWIDLSLHVSCNATVAQVIQESLRKGNLLDVVEATDMMIVDETGDEIHRQDDRVHSAGNATNEASSWMKHHNVRSGSQLFVVKRVNAKDYGYTLRIHSASHTTTALMRKGGDGKEKCAVGAPTAAVPPESLEEKKKFADEPAEASKGAEKKPFSAAAAAADPALASTDSAARGLETENDDAPPPPSKKAKAPPPAASVAATVRGIDDLTLHVPGNVPFVYVKHFVERNLRLAYPRQRCGCTVRRIVFAGKTCRNDRRLFEYGCQKGSTLHVVVDDVPS